MILAHKNKNICILLVITFFLNNAHTQLIRPHNIMKIENNFTRNIIYIDCNNRKTNMPRRNFPRPIA